MTRPPELAPVRVLVVDDSATVRAVLRRMPGGVTLVQDEASSVVFGMPRAALVAGAADLALVPAALARHLVVLCGATDGRTGESK